MELSNGTAVQEFILLGFGVGPQGRFLLLSFFTILYILTLAENITIITLVLLDTHLAQLPMYILLSNFSWLEICYVSTTVPRMLLDLVSPCGTISFSACFLQFYAFFSLGTTESFILSAMGLDRYLAICHPLRYPQLMSQRSCYVLVVCCWILGFLWHSLPVILISKLSFCGPNIIDHFVCDIGSILSVACPPLGNVVTIRQLAMNTGILINAFFVVLSYSTIIFTLLKKSNQGSHRKAFSTVFFHLVVVTLFYGSLVGMYLVPGGEDQSGLTKATTVFYTAVTPSLNPPIYCLRNDQVKEALRRALKRRERWPRQGSQNFSARGQHQIPGTVLRAGKKV